MLEIQGISKTFNPGTVNEKVAIRDLSLTLNDGDFVTVIGGNGAGKSTLLNLIAGVFPVDGGSIRLTGQDPMTGTSATMNIEENLALAARRGQRRTLRWGVTKKEQAEFRDRLATLELGLEDRMTSKVGLLSGGQRQALTLLMASLQRPELLLLDEHTAALDPKTAAKVLTLSDEIIREGNLTAMMITHNMRDALAYGNRLIMMDAGHVALDVAGEEKKKLTVQDLMNAFSQASNFASDRTLLG